MDMILGRFADRHLGSMSESELEAFELILGAPDPDLFAWVTGRSPPPPGLDRALLRRISEDDGR
jgi:antitoxin CptB